MVARGGRWNTIHNNREHVYPRLKRKGYSKRKAARIANAGNTRWKRSLMAKRAWRTRRRRYGRNGLRGR